LALIAAACAADFANRSNHPLDQQQVDQIEDRVQKLRQLSFLQPVPVVVKNSDYVAEQAEMWATRTHTDDELRASSAAGAFLGRIPFSIDLKSGSVTYLRKHLAGRYDPITKEMFLVAKDGDSDLLNQRKGKMILAHEFTHALQDQHFHLERTEEHLESIDRARAFHAMVEGDATIVEYAYDADKMDQAMLDRLLSRIEERIKTPHSYSTEIIEGSLIAARADGIKFVAEAYRRGAWPAVDALYSTPPLSMHQILHRADYFDHPKPPVEVEVSGFEDAVPNSTLMERETFGEPALRDIIERNLDKEAPEMTLAEQWAGDQAVTLRSQDGQIVVIWIVVFSSSDAAQKFTVVYANILDKVLSTTGHQVVCHDDSVVVIAGTPARTLAETIWANSKINAGQNKTAKK